MDQQNLRTLKILEEIEKDQSPSQRELAKKLNISLGLVNSFIKRLTQKGYFKVTTIPKNRIKYILTPKGFAEKTRLTYEYIQLSYHFYRDARSKLKKLFVNFEKNNIQRIVFFSAGDLAEIAYLSMQETSIQLIAIVDKQKKGDQYLNQIVKDPDLLPSMVFDKVLITSDKPSKKILEKISSYGIPKEKIEMVM